MAQTVGFIGLGNIGAPMAEHLCGGAFEVLVYDVRPEACAPLVARGAQAAGSVAELGSRCEFLGLCVRDDRDARSVLLGEDGVFSAAKPDTVALIHSTIHPRTVKELAAAASERGIHVVDATITGGAMGAKQGTLCSMVGAEPEVLERIRVYLDCFSREIVHTGPTGSGAALKLCNNLMQYLSFLAGYEASTLVREAGLEQQALLDVTHANGIMDPQTQTFLMMRGIADSKADDEGFQQMLLGFTTLAEKDLALTLEFARDLGLSLPGTGLCQQLMGRIYGLADPKRR